MATLDFTRKYALVHYQQAVLEKYNPELINEDDDLDYLEEKMNDLHESGSFAENWTIITKNETGEVVDLYTGVVFDIPSYK